MGWLVFLGLGLMAMLALRFLGKVRGDEGLLALAALFVAAAGYTWQGSPGIAGAPAQGQAVAKTRPDTLYEGERDKLLRVYGEPSQWLTLADALGRTGDDLGAAQVLQGAVHRNPKSTALGIGYAHALLTVADYNVSPAVSLAFDRAAAADPGDPAPRYFEGLAHFEQGDVMGAETLWRGARDALPTDSQWRAVLDQRLKLIDMIKRGA